MKKILLTLIMLVPALLADGQGPIKSWNDQLDDFITNFNETDTALGQLYSDNGISAFIFTYFEPESGNVIKEASVFDDADFEKIDDALMKQAKDIALGHLSKGARENARIKSILNEFQKRGTDIVLLYSTPIGDTEATKSVILTPAEILTQQ